MIVAANKTASLPEFRELMRQADILLNAEVKRRGDRYYSDKNGVELESIVVDALNQAAEGTSFKDTINLVSGAAFPDIVASQYYGVEVKSTNKNHWLSTGSSILESTRITSVERIYLTFGKLGAPVKFLSRPYEECLYDISVTHYPRYRIDMQLKKGESIFDKMGIAYDDLRDTQNPAKMVSRVAQYYKKQLKPGECLWWSNSENIEDESSPVTVRLWSTLSTDKKEELTAYGFALFPEIFELGNQQKYNRYSLWLVTRHGIVNNNIRDLFSAGGKISMRNSKGVNILMPAVIGKIPKYKNLIISTIYDTNSKTLMDYWNTTQIEKNRVAHWCRLVATAIATTTDTQFKSVWNVLQYVFPELEAI